MLKFSKPAWPDVLDVLKRWGPTGLWMFMIFSASSDSGSFNHSSRFVEPFFRWLMPTITPDTLNALHIGVRKGAHMTEFALLGILILHGLSKSRDEFRQWASVAWVLCIAYAATDEFHQCFVPNRGPSVVDVGIDALGAGLGLLGYLFFTGNLHLKSQPGTEPGYGNPDNEELERQRRPAYADRVICTLEGEDLETRSAVRLAVQDRLQREHGGRLILGRNRQAAHLHIKNTSISGQHLALIFRTGRVELEDLGSSNGTRLNGRKLTPFQPVALSDGARIEAGEIVLLFRQFAR